MTDDPFYGVHSVPAEIKEQARGDHAVAGSIKEELAEQGEPKFPRGHNGNGEEDDFEEKRFVDLGKEDKCREKTGKEGRNLSKNDPKGVLLKDDKDIEQDQHTPDKLCGLLVAKNRQNRD